MSEVYTRNFVATASLEHGVASGSIAFTRSTGATYFDATSKMVTVTANLPSWHHSRNPIVPLGLVMEEDIINYALRSEEISHGYHGKDEVTVVADQSIAPDGNTIMDRVLESANEANHKIDSTFITVAASKDHTLSAFVRKHGNRYMEMWTSDQGDPLDTWVIYDLDNALIAAEGTEVQTAGIDDLGGGLFYIWQVGGSSSGGTQMINHFSTNRDGLTHDESYTGSTGVGFDLWGTQFLKDDTMPSSYRKTTLAVATRAVAFHVSSLADIITGEFSVYYKGKTSFVESRILDILDPGFTEDVFFARVGGNLDIQVRNFPTTINMDMGALADDTEFRVAVRFKDNDFAASLNGAALVTEAGQTMSNSLGEFRLRPFNQAHHELYVYSGGLSNDTLLSLAANGPDAGGGSVVSPIAIIIGIAI